MRRIIAEDQFYIRIFTAACTMWQGQNQTGVETVTERIGTKFVEDHYNRRVYSWFHFKVGLTDNLGFGIIFKLYFSYYRIYDLNTASGRQSAMTDLSLLRNIELRKESINL